MPYTQTQLIALRDELLAGHPDTGAYSADNKVAKGQLNAANRPAPTSDMNTVVQFVTLEGSRTNSGGDVTKTSIYGRAKTLAAASVGDNPWGVASPQPSLTVTAKHIGTAAAFVRLMDLDSQALVPIADTRFAAMLQDLVDVGVMKPVDRTALLGLADNKISRIVELELPTPRVADIEAARIAV